MPSDERTERLANELWVLLRLCHENGKPEDGFRFREAVQNVRAIVGNELEDVRDFFLTESTKDRERLEITVYEDDCAGYFRVWVDVNGVILRSQAMELDRANRTADKLRALLTERTGQVSLRGDPQVVTIDEPAESEPEPERGEGALLPCPFCGGPAEFVPSSDTNPQTTPPYAGCPKCDVWCDDAAAWNQRAACPERDEGAALSVWAHKRSVARLLAGEETTIGVTTRPMYPESSVPVHFGAASPEPAEGREGRCDRCGSAERWPGDPRTCATPDCWGTIATPPAPAAGEPEVRLADYPEDDDVTAFFASCREVQRWMALHGFDSLDQVRRFTP